MLVYLQDGTLPDNEKSARQIVMESKQLMVYFTLRIVLFLVVGVW